MHQKKYPVENIVPLLKKTLRKNNICLLSAPPGAGKTTVIPPALLHEPWLNNKKIIMLEPRRIAARRAAEFIASLRSEKCGDTIGYRIRSEALVGNRTRIEIVTEGILTRMLHSDMELPEAGLVIFDEFHERSIHADLSLAFLLDVQKNIRDDLRILIMSATPDTKKICERLNNPPVIVSEGRTFPVETLYLKEKNEKPVEIRTAEAIFSVLNKEDGDILVFLPGKKEIRSTSTLLYQKYKELNNIVIHELYGEASGEQQNSAIEIDPHERRKIILTTSLAETSLTIDGIRIVIDSGLSRLPAYNIKRGMPGLVTVPVSKASADQRRGRAGRQQPGVCYRLYTIEQELTHPDFTIPEILSSDLTYTVLDLIKWGSPSGEGLVFIDSPPPSHLKKALSTLHMLGATDSNNKLTQSGFFMSEMPLHPRLSAMIHKAKSIGLTYQACLLASLLEERELTRARNNLVEVYRMVLESKVTDVKVRNQADRLFSLTKESRKQTDDQKVGVLLSYAFPDRIAKKKNDRQYQLVNGTAAILPEGSSLRDEEFLVIIEIDASEAVAKIFLAAGLTKQDVLKTFENNLQENHTITWDNDHIKGTRNLMLGSIPIHISDYIPDEHEVISFITELIRTKGLSILPWNNDAVSLRTRSEWFRNNFPDSDDKWPVLSDEALNKNVNIWLPPFLSGIRKRKDLDKLNMVQILRSLFSFQQITYLDKEVPESMLIPGGSKIKLKYDQSDKPVLAVRIQELFGQTDTPGICSGRISVLIHLLSPAMRPLAITQDLKSFWINTYPELLKQMRVKYPKHVWPDNPLLALPTNKTKKYLNKHS